MMKTYSKYPVYHGCVKQVIVPKKDMYAVFYFETSNEIEYTKVDVIKVMTVFEGQEAFDIFVPCSFYECDGDKGDKINGWSDMGESLSKLTNCIAFIEVDNADCLPKDTNTHWKDRIEEYKQIHGSKRGGENG